MLFHLGIHFLPLPVNCYGKDLCIRAVAYIPIHRDIRVEAAENNIKALDSVERRSFFLCLHEF
jgi:hypothetical protein